MKFNHLALMTGIAVTGAVGSGAFAPAQAAHFYADEFGVAGKTSNFNSSFVKGSNFSVTFNPSGATTLTGAGITDSMGSTVLGISNFNPTPVGTSTSFTYVSNSGNDYIYKLANNLVINFKNNLSFRLAGGSLFTGQITGTGTTQTVNLALASGIASFKDGVDVTDFESLAFSFSDIPNGNNPGRGNYSINGTFASVPEPFTIIGTFVGGTAAVRMRKKLTSAKKA
jgi:hypothetical protein